MGGAAKQGYPPAQMCKLHPPQNVMLWTAQNHYAPLLRKSTARPDGHPQTGSLCIWLLRAQLWKWQPHQARPRSM